MSTPLSAKTESFGSSRYDAAETRRNSSAANAGLRKKEAIKFCRSNWFGNSLYKSTSTQNFKQDSAVPKRNMKEFTYA